MLTRHLYAIAATGLSQQLQKLDLPDNELIEQVLRSSSKEGATKSLRSRKDVLDILSEETLPYIMFEYQLEQERVAEIERREREERDKERRKADVPIGLPLTIAAMESLITALPRGTVVLLDGDAAAVKAAIYAICNNLLKASSQPKTLFMRCRDSLHGSDFDVSKRVDHRVALVPQKIWRYALQSGSGWRKFVDEQTRRLRDAVCDCILIEDATLHHREGMVYPDKLRRMDTVVPMLLRQARDTQSVVIAGVPGTKTGEGSGCYADTDPPRIKHTNVILATVNARPTTDGHEFTLLQLLTPLATRLAENDPAASWCEPIDEFHNDWFQDPQLIL